MQQKKISLSDFFYQWELRFENYITTLNKKDEKTIANYTNVTNKFIEYIQEAGQDDKEVYEVNTDFLLEFFSWRDNDAVKRIGRELKSSTKQNDKKIIRLFFEFIEEKVEDDLKLKLRKKIQVDPDEYIEFNIKWKRIKFKKELHEHEHYDQEIVVQILNYLENQKKKERSDFTYMLSFCFKLALFGGLRATEICNVKLKDFSKPYVSKDNKMKFIKLTIYGKGNTKYTNPLQYDHIKNELNWFKRKYDEDDQLFHSKTGKVLDRMILYRYFESISNELMLGKKGIHIIRHTYASTLNELNIDIRNIQILMRHSSIKTTTIYTAKSDKALEKSLSALQF